MNYIESIGSFKSFFSKRLYNKIVKDSTIRCIRKVSKKEYNEIMEELYNELLNNNYIVGVPDEKVFLYKKNSIARIVPVLSIKDELLYYFVCKILEDKIAINRVKNTFGGWKLGNKIMLEEESEIDYVYKSYNPALWKENWREFQNLLYCQTSFMNEDEIVLKLDIANFYDSINLNILEKMLLVVINRERLEYVNILMYFLRSWNLKYENFHMKTVGIPQNEFGDQSRILANFYLQNYDETIKEICDKNNAIYFRFADDQFIIIKNTSIVNDVLYVMSRELNKIGLNFNADKTKKYKKDEIQRLYGIRIHQLLDEEKFDNAAKLFLEYIRDDSVEFNYTSSLKRFLNVGFDRLDIIYKNEIQDFVMSKDFIKDCSEYYLTKIYSNLLEEEKDNFINKLYEISNETTYNSFHYGVMSFFEKNQIEYDKEIILNRIKEIKEL